MLYEVSHAQNAQKCPKGRYVQGRKCKPCPAGQKQDKDNFSGRRCTLCLKGEYQDKRGSDECKKCPINQFQNKPGQPSCRKCPAGQTTQTPGAEKCQGANSNNQQLQQKVEELENDVKDLQEKQEEETKSIYSYIQSRYYELYHTGAKQRDFIKFKQETEAKIGKIEGDIDQLQGQVGKDTWARTRVSELETKLRDRYRQGFMAVLERPMSIPALWKIVFGKEIDDRGSNYNNNNGIYTVPKTGWYYISSAVHSKNGKMVIRLEVDEKIKCRGASDGDSNTNDQYATINCVLELFYGQSLRITSEWNLSMYGQEPSKGYATWFSVTFLY